MEQDTCHCTLISKTDQGGTYFPNWYFKTTFMNSVTYKSYWWYSIWLEKQEEVIKKNMLEVENSILEQLWNYPYLLDSSPRRLTSISLVGGYLGRLDGTHAYGSVVKNCMIEGCDLRMKV